MEAKIRNVTIRYASYLKRKGLRPAGLEVKAKQRAVIEMFLKGCVASKKCENCNAYSPTYRKDGYSKIFQKPLSKKTQRAMQMLKMKYKTALELTQGDSNPDSDKRRKKSKKGTVSFEGDDSDEDHGPAEEADESDDEDEAGNPKPAAADKYMPQNEVEAQIKLLWQNHVDFLDFIWSRAVSPSSGERGMPSAKLDVNGYKLFFQRCVLVPPNRFRPMAKVGESSAEHPQNHNLSKIITANENIRRLIVDSTGSLKPIEEAINIDGATGEELPNQPQSHMTRLISVWIELQNAVNMFLDSAKNPNPLGGGDVPGVRQILERKEGLFRRHMMGKRVNYCCRSVISPDPYIGTNEVGIPVLFAKTLHFPVPVNDWNVKHLRKLVENGPNEYPGD